MLESEIAEGVRRMERTVEVLKTELAGLRAGRANPALLNKIEVNYYGSPTPLNQVANISAPEARLLVVQPWDRSVINDIEKAILKSDLGLTPNNDGTIIRLAIPQLTEERRKELVKMARKIGEEAKVAVRNIRRDMNDMVKKAEKTGEITEDQSRSQIETIQKATDKHIEEIDRLLVRKEQEIMEV